MKCQLTSNEKLFKVQFENSNKKIKFILFKNQFIINFKITCQKNAFSNFKNSSLF